MLSAFELFPGEQQGRIVPKGWTAPDGSFVLCLGADTPGRTGIFLNDDLVQWSVTGLLFTAPAIVRMRARVRAPASMPTGMVWVLGFQGDGSANALNGSLFTEIACDRDRDLFDIAVNVGAWTPGSFQIYAQITGGTPGQRVEVELPAIYIDAIAIDTDAHAPSNGMVFGNRYPEPNENNVPLDAWVAFDVMFATIGAGPADLTTSSVWINGALAYSAGNFLAPFDGPLSQVITLIDNGTGAEWIFDPTVPFASEETVTVRARIVSSVSPTDVADETWAFTIADFTPPRVISAMAIDTKTVRVSFDEPIAQELQPSSYLFTRLSIPAVDVVAVSVVLASATTVEVTTDIDLTPGATYELVVVNVTDLVGNTVAPPNDTVTFVAFVPPRPLTRRFDLWQFLPRKNRDEDTSGELRLFISCLQEITDLMLFDVDRFTTIFDPDIAPEWAVDLMLTGLGNPFAFTLSLANKRRLLRILTKIYALKGTAVGLIEVVLFFLGIPITIISYTGESLVLGESLLGVDWELGPSNAWAIYSFEIVAPFALTDDQRTQIAGIANYMKPAHTHLARIVEPVLPDVIDHIELGLSELGTEWILH